MIRPIVDPPRRVRRRQRQSLKVNLRRAIDVAQQSGITVNSVRVYADGSFAVSSTPLGTETGDDYDQWKDKI